MEYPYRCVCTVLKYTDDNIKSTENEGLTNIAELFRQQVHLLILVVDNNKMITVNADLHQPITSKYIPT